MKKIVAFVLALAMVLTSVAALAASTEKKTSVTGDNLNVDVYGTTTSDKSTFFQDNKTTATSKTAMWLRVKAEGQINCTIPLVLIYETNIDGGKVSTGTAYGIKNNSKANVAVTSIQVTGSAKTAGVNPMELVTETAFSEKKQDAYYAKMEVDKASVHGAVESNFKMDFADHTTSAFEKKANLGGHFFIEPTKTVNIDVTVETKPLSFVTKTKADDSMDKQMGIHLLDVVYVVAIDTYTATTGGVTYGEIIQNTDGIPGTDYTTPTSPAPMNYTYGTGTDGKTTIVGNDAT